jgi:hypothetical protein
MQGVILEVTAEGKALSIERIRIPCEEEADERARRHQ